MPTTASSRARCPSPSAEPAGVTPSHFQHRDLRRRLVVASHPAQAASTTATSRPARRACVGRRVSASNCVTRRRLRGATASSPDARAPDGGRELLLGDCPRPDADALGNDRGRRRCRRPRARVMRQQEASSARQDLPFVRRVDRPERLVGRAERVISRRSGQPEGMRRARATAASARRPGPPRTAPRRRRGRPASHSPTVAQALRFAVASRRRGALATNPSLRAFVLGAARARSPVARRSSRPARRRRGRRRGTPARQRPPDRHACDLGASVRARR